jgi:hypothetical protein
VVASTELSDNHTDYGYPKFKINFSKDFVVMLKPGTYNFHPESNYILSSDFETKTQASTHESQRQSFAPKDDQDKTFNANDSDEVFTNILNTKASLYQESKPNLEIE